MSIDGADWGDPVRLEMLWTDPSGRPYAFGTPTGGLPIYVGWRLLAKLNWKLTGAWQSVDNQDPSDVHELVRTMIEQTLADLRYRTVPGALTTTEKPESIDYLCMGPQVQRWWPDLGKRIPDRQVVTAVVRRVPAHEDAIAVTAKDKTGLVNLLITMTPKSKRWKQVIAGEPVDELTSTYLLKPGDRFDPSVHCDWRVTDQS